MQVPVTECVRRAEAGEDIILRRHGRPAIRLVAIRAKAGAERRRAALDVAMARIRDRAPAGADAARSQDFLYDGNGLPA